MALEYGCSELKKKQRNRGSRKSIIYMRYAGPI